MRSPASSQPGSGALVVSPLALAIAIIIISVGVIVAGPA